MTKIILAALILLLLLASCTSQVQQTDVTFNITADGISQIITLPVGSTVQQALTVAGISLSQTDRVVPPVYTLVLEGSSITVTRVRDEFESQLVIIPFERQELQNESLPTGETRLVQAGENGLREITIRHIFENDIETGTSEVSENILEAPKPEILMIGVQSPFAPLPIPGKLAYLTAGNAWIMEDSTSNRQPLVTTADLDGRIFTLSPDGKWLLFSRKSDLPADQETNTLWVVNTEIQPVSPVSLRVSNVVHFASWQPGKEYVIAYSTVEPRASSPGWQANNDLHLLSFINSEPGHTQDILETNAGCIYGWWGMTFLWSPDGTRLAYSCPDGIGLVDLDNGEREPLITITPLNTHSLWAWNPGLVWGRDGQTIYFVNHAAPTGLVSPEESPNFDLGAFSINNDSYITIVQQTGMFAYPTVSSWRSVDSGSRDMVTYLQATFPTQSITSNYQLKVVNGDGTNERFLFPSEGQSGLQPPIQPVWAPALLENSAKYIGLIYSGNLWIVDAGSGLSQQVTGDGLTSQIDWK